MKAGIAQAVQAAGEGGGDFVPAEQLALLPLRQTQAAQGGGNLNPPVRGAGRPSGSKNKRTQEWADFLLKQYSSPLVGLAELYSRKVADLAEELGFTKKGDGGINTRTATPQELLEILRLQVAAMKELAPYVHQKQPMAIDAGEGGFLNLVLNVGQEQAAAKQDEGFSFELLDVTPKGDNEQNQILSDNLAQNSNCTHSNGFAEGVENND